MLRWRLNLLVPCSGLEDHRCILVLTSFLMYRKKIETFNAADRCFSVAFLSSGLVDLKPLRKRKFKTFDKIKGT